MLLAAAGTVVVAAPDPLAAGKAVFDRYCASCHEISIGARNGEGPPLNGILGRPAATGAGYAYSPALRRSALVWTAGSLDTFIADPRGAVPGTHMTVPGVGSAADRAAIVAYVIRFGSDGKTKPVSTGE